MKVGINILNFGPRATPALLARWGQVAEELGYHLLAISDHVVNTPDVQTQYPAPFYDLFVTLGWLAAQAPGLEIGTTVAILPYRHPLQTARMAANLDQLSGGRLILGVGVGWARQEFAALGVRFDRTRRADRRLPGGDHGLLDQRRGQPIPGGWCRLSRCIPRHGRRNRRIRRSGLPAASDAALQRAIRFGQGWHPINIRVDWLRDIGLPRLRALAETLERPVPALCARIKLTAHRYAACGGKSRGWPGHARPGARGP